jgi:hypothetical protein
VSMREPCGRGEGGRARGVGGWGGGHVSYYVMHRMRSQVAAAFLKRLWPQRAPTSEADLLKLAIS